MMTTTDGRRGRPIGLGGAVVSGSEQGKSKVDVARLGTGCSEMVTFSHASSQVRSKDKHKQ